jgi:hypothetical protein
MVFEHRMFRREFRLAPAMIRAVAEGDTARAALVGDFFDQLANRLHHHLADELLDRVHDVDPDLADRMMAQRERITGLLDRVNVLLPRWWHTADDVTRDLLADVIAEAAVALDEHLTAEENEILPLVGDRGRHGFPRSANAFVFVGALLEDAPPIERTAFLKLLPVPTRLAWHLVGRGIHRRAVRRMRGTRPSACAA